MHIRTKEWYLETFRTYGFELILDDTLKRKKDNYNDEVIFCIRPIYMGSSDVVEDSPDAIILVDKKTKKFCCGQSCWQTHLNH